MIRRVLVDCDVVLDLLLAREPYFPAATNLFMSFQDERLRGFVSPLLFSNLYYILRKALSPRDAIGALRKLRLVVGVLSVDDRTVDLALSSSFTDFEDALQYYTAVTHDLDALITRNKRDYKPSRIPVLNAEEAVEILRAQG
jgi:predicted nucleic acid-binding protein